MEIDPADLHTMAAAVAVLLGVAGPVVALLYAIRVERRDHWRKPMLVTGSLTFVGILAAYFSGRWLVDQQPGLRNDVTVAPHLEYADRLLLPGAGFFVLVLLCGMIHPRTGMLRIVLPLLLTGFALVVFALVVLSSDSGARLLLEKLRDAV